MTARILIFIPAYNEEKTIGTVVLLAKKYGKVVVVDDGSTDRTAIIAKEAGAAVLRHTENRGYGAALKTALGAARETEARAYVFLDGDLQHNPDEIPAVAAPILDGKADVSLGSRFLGKFISAHPGRKEGVLLINALSSVDSGKGHVDSQCGFRAFSRKAVGETRITQDGYSAGSEAIAGAQRMGMRLVEVPVQVRYYEERNGNALAQAAGLVAFLIGEISKHRPDVLFVAGGLVALLVSLLIGVFVIDTMHARGVLPTGSALLTVFFGLAGLVMVMFGITLNALERMRRRD